MSCVFQVLSDDNDKFDTETLKQALQQYPMLLSALMPTQSVLKCDIDIYQMLKVCFHFELIQGLCYFLTNDCHNKMCVD